MAIILGETGRNDVCLQLGKQGEHDVTFFEFDFSLWAAKYGDGVLSLRLTPNGSATAYPVTLDFDGTIATFTVTATDTATAGLGSAELVYIVGDDEKLKKSVSYVTSVEPSDDTGDAPDPYDEWLAHLEVLAGETSQAKTDAEQAASEAKASEQAAATSEQNAKTSEDNAEEYANSASGYADTASDEANRAEAEADRAEQAAANAGYMFFYIDDNGHLIYQRTSNTQVDFYLQNGHLFVEAIA